jgi:hypothetical protein
MGEINIPGDQQRSLAAVDTEELAKLIDHAILMERSGELRAPLANCGSYIATQLNYFERALAKHREARAPRKRAETAYDLRRAASDLSHAVWAMKARMEAEQKEGESFFVDDQISSPHRFSKHLGVRVTYRWRRTPDDQWIYGSITFTHEVDLRPEYTIPAPKRKTSAAKKEKELQEILYRTWEHLKRGALFSVRDYFKDGGDGDKIPNAFKATVDSYSRGLNNYSTQFWRQ